MKILPSAYEAYDGKLFKTEEECEQYEHATFIDDMIKSYFCYDSKKFVEFLKNFATDAFISELNHMYDIYKEVKKFKDEEIPF